MILVSYSFSCIDITVCFVEIFVSCYLKLVVIVVIAITVSFMVILVNYYLKLVIVVVIDISLCYSDFSELLL